MTKPCEPLPTGAIVTRVASGRMVFDGGGREFVKVAPRHPEVDPQREAGE